MKIGEKLLSLRKKQGLSQEEAADQLNVSRQTISKWETDQSTPDFDKIVPICELYGISVEELLTGKKESLKETVPVDKEARKRKKAFGIGLGVLLYFIACAWIMISIPVLFMNPIVASAGFLIICGVATFIIVYVCIIYKKEKTKKEEKENKVVKQITDIVAMIFLIIYLFVSFLTMAWHITWLLWIVYALVEQVIKLVFMLKGDTNEE